jgi:hypothetical protein
MSRFSSRCRHVVRLALCICAVGFSVAAVAAKPLVPVTYSEVNITFGGQTFGFFGAENSFSQSETGGVIVFDVRQLGTPEFAPLPQVDTKTLEPKGNHWEVETNTGGHSYMFVGTCASETYTTTESGSVIRHLNLNCKDLVAP